MIESKICSLCKIEKPLTEFHKCKREKFGVKDRCKNCRSLHPGKHRRKNIPKPLEGVKECRRCKRILPYTAFAASPYTDDGAYHRCTRCRTLLYKYNIDLNGYNELCKIQNYKCGICKSEIDKNFAVDHDHETNKIRGLLCRNCNLCLGLAGDTIDKVKVYIDNMIKYLEGNFNEC